MVKVKDRSLKDRLISAIRGQQALQARNGKVNAYIALTTIYKILKAETKSEKAQVRGILNRDYIKGLKVFDRAPASDAKKRLGAYRLHVEEVVESSVEATEGLAA